MRLRTTFLTIAGLLAGGALTVPADAGIIDQDLPGTTQYDGWSDLSASNPQVQAENTDGDSESYPGFMNATDAWPAPIESHTTGSGDAALAKVSGSGYPASASIYSPSNGSVGGTFAVRDETPVSELEAVVFQIEIGSGFPGGNLPTLSYNGGSQTLNADTSALLSQTTGSGGGFETTISTWLTQWDLTGVANPINAFEVEWSTVPHGQLYSARLDQSDTYAAATTSVPTPSAFAMGVAGFGLMALRRRRRAGTA